MPGADAKPGAMNVFTSLLLRLNGYGVHRIVNITLADDNDAGGNSDDDARDKETIAAKTSIDDDMCTKII